MLIAGFEYNFLLFGATAFKENYDSYCLMQFGDSAWEFIKVILAIGLTIAVCGVCIILLAFGALAVQIFWVTGVAFYCQVFVSPEACRQVLRDFLRRFYVQSSCVRVFLRGLRVCASLFWDFVRYRNVSALRELLELLGQLFVILSRHYHNRD